MITTIIWSPHAKERSVKRAGATWWKLHETIDRHVRVEAWEIWWENDRREKRGIVANHVVPVDEAACYAVLRRGPGERPNEEVLIVVSLLTREQYEKNKKVLWFRSYEECAAGTRTLKHTPFSNLKIKE